MANSQLLNQGRGQSPDRIPVKNTDSVSIAKLTPVVFAMGGTRDGFDVIRPSAGATAQGQGLIAGVLEQDLAVGQVGTAIVRGVVDNVPYIIRTRAGTTGTDVWATEAALSLGQPMSLNTAMNMFETATAAHEGHIPMIAVGEIVASLATGATTTATAGFGTSTASTGTVKVYLRVL